ncbi:hypothetical protein ACI79R_04305 [Blastococcus sp. SYSU D00820]
MVTWQAPPPGTRRSGRLLAAVAVGALAVGVAGGVVGGVRAADDQARVDELSSQVTGLEEQVAGLQAEVEDTRAQAAEDVAEARTEAEAAVAAENAAAEAALTQQAADLAAREAAVAAREDAVIVLEQQAADGSVPGTGLFLVGSEIAPGTYRASDGGDCYWERLSGLSGEFDELITNGFGAADATVTVRAGDVAFSSDGCGTWQRIG